MSGIDGEAIVLSPDISRLLNSKYLQFNVPDFIPFDPVSIPHRFSLKQDIEIAGLFAAILAWGLRKTIINKCTELLGLMDNAPYDFVLHHQPDDLKRLESFRHRTFNPTDLLYFIHFLKEHYRRYDSLEDAFLSETAPQNDTTEQGLIHFHEYFCNSEYFPERTRKHIATPLRKSTCKRLNMYLRWMVRQDRNGVDFGICPTDLPLRRACRPSGPAPRIDPASGYRLADCVRVNRCASYSRPRRSRKVRFCSFWAWY